MGHSWTNVWSISLDFVENRHSAVVDERWTDIVGGSLLKLVLWYDNEAGYSLRVLDQIKYVEDCANRSWTLA